MSAVRRLIVTALALTLAGLAHATPLSRDDRGRFTIPLQVNGGASYDFVVDTAAGGHVLAPILVESLGLQPEPGVRARMQGASGVVDVPLYRVSSLAGPDIDLRDVLAASMPNASVSTASGGVIGFPAFLSGRLEFDFVNPSLAVGPSGPTPADYVALPGSVLHRGFMVIEMTISGVPVKAVVDTGAARTTANSALQSALGIAADDPRLAPAEPVRGATEHETPAVALAGVGLEIGGVQMPDTTLTFAELSVFRALGLADQPAIILGIDVLGRLGGLAIDYPRGEVQVRPR